MVVIFEDCWVSPIDQPNVGMVWRNRSGLASPTQLGVAEDWKQLSLSSGSEVRARLEGASFPSLTGSKESTWPSRQARGLQGLGMARVVSESPYDLERSLALSATQPEISSIRFFEDISKLLKKSKALAYLDRIGSDDESFDGGKAPTPAVVSYARSLLFELTVEFGEIVDDAHFVSDENGGIEITLSHGDRHLQIIVPEQKDPYVFFKQNEEYGIESLTDSYETTGWIHWLLESDTP